MNTQPRRYIFITYDDLRQIKLKKLSSVSSRIFAFVPTELESVPLPLVLKLQKLGDQVKWISIDAAVDGDLQLQMGFLMGKLHHKVSGDIEFAVLSNDEDFDPLVDFINADGRACLRVKRQGGNTDAIEERPTETPSALAHLPSGSVVTNEIEMVKKPVVNQPQSIPKDTKVVEEVANETIGRLIRSGNRPAEVETLVEYIQLHHSEIGGEGVVRHVISHMAMNNSIELQGSEIIYHF